VQPRSGPTLAASGKLSMQELYADGEDTPFVGKVVLIAGSCQEVSEASARLFAKRGAEGVLLGGRHVERGQAVAAIISAAGCAAEFLPTDFTKLEDCAALIAEADKVFGRIDVLIIAAGMVPPRAGVEQLADYFDQLVAINQRAPFFVMLRAAELMQRAERAGTIVTVLGVPGEGEPLPVAAYEAGQGGLAAITRSFAAGLIDYRIRVLGLDVGGCEALSGVDICAGPASTGRPARPAFGPQEIAAAVALLVTDPEQPPAGSIVPIAQLLPAIALSPEPPPAA
jgi:NAD(P)-dependent dehydrogenase (short-subunit alcohol dehydrogenase family)